MEDTKKIEETMNNYSELSEISEHVSSLNDDSIIGLNTDHLALENKKFSTNLNSYKTKCNTNFRSEVLNPPSNKTVLPMLPAGSLNLKKLFALESKDRDKNENLYLPDGKINTLNIRKNILERESKKTVREGSLNKKPEFLDNAMDKHESENIFFLPRRKSFTINSRSKLKNFANLEFFCKN